MVFVEIVHCLCETLEGMVKADAVSAGNAVVTAGELCLDVVTDLEEGAVSGVKLMALPATKPIKHENGKVRVCVVGVALEHALEIALVLVRAVRQRAVNMGDDALEVGRAVLRQGQLDRSIVFPKVRDGLDYRTAAVMGPKGSGS